MSLGGDLCICQVGGVKGKGVHSVLSIVSLLSFVIGTAVGLCRLIVEMHA
jgi:hypothetical protein